MGFTRLADGMHAVMQEGKAKEARVVDVPGHARIANRIFSEHVERARGIVFLVDSVDFMGQKVRFQRLQRQAACSACMPHLTWA